MLIPLLPVSLASVPQDWMPVGAMLVLLARLQGTESPEVLCPQGHLVAFWVAKGMEEAQG